MKARYVIGTALAATGIAFVFGFATASVGDAAPGSRAAAAPPILSTPAPVTGRPPATAAGRQPLPTTRRFDPPPLPADDPGVAEIVNAPDEPSTEEIEARWQDVERRLEELFGQLSREKLEAIKTALTNWLRDHGRVVRAYYRGYIDQAELTDNIHANLLGFARALEATMTRDQYRTFTDLEPGEDPFLALVPPGVTVGQPIAPGADPNNHHSGGHAEDQSHAEDYGDPEHKRAP